MGRRDEIETDDGWQAQELIEREQEEAAYEQEQLKKDPAYAAWLDKIDKQTKEQQHDDNRK